jgi:hypothetical protein
MTPPEVRLRTDSQTWRPYLDLFLISFLILFFELACIRWFGSMVVYLTFFTNIVLLATFLGMSVGCLAASSKREWTRAVMPLFLIAVVLAAGVLWVFTSNRGVMVDVGGQASPQQVFFGTQYRSRDLSKFVVPLEVLAGVFFTLVALVFVGLGQVMGRAFNKSSDRLLAYIANIGGSIVGIAAFAFLSYLWATPLVWFVIVLLVWFYFLRDRTLIQLYTAVGTLALIGFLSYNLSAWAPYQNDAPFRVLLWSPYYKMVYAPRIKAINTNNIGHQNMISIDDEGPGYNLPHLLNHDAGGKPFEDVLIIGAGSGNDVAAALANGAKHVDAVEIDPAIYRIGHSEHPNRPYDDPRVSIHIDDGRSFVKNTTRKYDLVVYALVDSLVLHSGFSSLRLESFLFTKEAFEDISARLKPGGVFAVYNIFVRGFIVSRIDKMAEEVYGSKPLVMSLPYVPSIQPGDNQRSALTCILMGKDSPILAAIRREFDQRQAFWANNVPRINRTLNAFGPNPPAGTPATDWNKVAPANVDLTGIDEIPKDDWPFLYLREKMIPGLNIRSMILIAGLALALLYICSPVRTIQPNWQMFFLGAGFMLLETKSVVHMALLFGSTWIVNSIVFFAILMMILASNLFVLLVRSKRLWPYYVLLVASLAVNIVVPMSRFLALPGWERVAGSCAVVFVPIFFAGIVFATLFRDSAKPNIDFGSNIAGAILGGLAESLSLIIGFNYLLGLAILCYLLSAVSRRSSVSLPVRA